MKKANRFLSMLLSLCIVLGLVPSTAFAIDSNLPFTDVSATDWFYDAVQYVYDNDMMNGTSSTTFSPASTTTRGMIVTVLHRMEGAPAAAGTIFSDVPANDWCASAVAWASANNIVTGYGDGTFGPANAITREQLSAILYRYSQFKGYDTSAADSISGFSDAAQVGSFATDSMNWAVGNELIAGVGNQTLLPKGDATRAQVATILMRYCENVVPQQTEQEKMFTVVFDLNYDNNAQHSVKTVKAGEPVSKPANPARVGYAFGGWYTERTGGTRFDFNQGITSDMTLYAHWAVPGGSSSGSNSGGNSGSNGSSSKPTLPSTPNIPDDDGIYSKPIDPNHIKTGILEFEEETYEGDYIDNELVVVARMENDKQAVEDLIVPLGGTIVGEIPQIAYYQVEFPSAMTVTQLVELSVKIKANDYIEDAYINSINYYQDNAYYPNDLTSRWQFENPDASYSDYWGTVLWGHTACMVPEAWDLVLMRNPSPSIRMGLIDSGIDATHVDLNFISASGRNKKYDPYIIAKKYPEKAEHGTHVAGIMGARFNNNLGIAGVAINAELVGRSILYDFMGIVDQYASDFQMVEDVALLIEAHAEVINISQGTHRGKSSVKRAANRAVDYLSKYIDEGYNFLIVTSSGNNGIVKVGDTEKDNTNDNVNNNNLFCNISENKVKNRIIVVGNVIYENYSTYARDKTSSYRGGRVDVMAPGTTIYSTLPNNRYGTTKSNGEPLSGTSMASPFVAGLAGLIWEANPNLTPERVKEIICETATIPVNDSYANMVNAEAAVAKALSILPQADMQFSFTDKVNGGSPSCQNVKFTCLLYSRLAGYYEGNTFDISSINNQSLDLIPFIFPEKPEDNFSAASIKLPYGNYSFKISADGYKDKAVSFVVSSRNNTIDVTLEKELTPTEPILGLTISGTVIDSTTEKPIEGVNVYLNCIFGEGGEDAGATAVTAADGSFKLTAPDNATDVTGVQFEKEGYNSYLFPLISNANSSVDIGKIKLVPISTSNEDTFAGGDGTKANPYQIATVEQLQNIFSDLSANYILTANINCSQLSDWVPIGTEQNGFSGHFDGDGHSISNLTCSQGLFGHISQSGTVENVNLSNFEVSAGQCGGFIASHNNGVIQYCKISGSISGTSGQHLTNFVGGVAGDNAGTIQYCSVSTTGDESMRGTTIGGIAGRNTGTIVSSISSCSISGKTESNGLSLVGGIVGYNYGGTVKFCKSTSDIVTSVVYAGCACGGIAGANAGTINTNYFNGRVYAHATTTNYGARAGGIVGSNGDRWLGKGGNVSQCVYELSENSSATGLDASDSNYCGTIENNYDSALSGAEIIDEIEVTLNF